MQLSFKEHFQPIVFQELKDWKMERSCMKDDICLLDHHQRSHWNTITIGPKGMVNWVLQLKQQPVGKLVQQSLGETLQGGSPKPNQSPNPIGDRTGKLVTQETVGKLQGELGSSDRTGKPVKDEDNCVMNVHDRTRKLVEASSHKVQEVGSLENRDNTSSNANKFNLVLMNWSNIEQEIPEVQLEENTSKLNAKDLACRSKRRELAKSSPRTVLVEKRTWNDIVKNTPPNTENSMHNMATTKTTITTWAMRPSVRPTTAWTTSETTPTIAWCTPCVERARRAHSSTLDVVSHLIGSRSESCHFISVVIHGRTSLIHLSLSTSTCSSLSSFPSTSCTPICTVNSTTRSSWKACATPPTNAYDVTVSLTDHEGDGKRTGRYRWHIERDRCTDFQTSCRHGALHVDRSSVTPVFDVRGDELNEWAKSGSSVAGSARGPVCSATSGRDLVGRIPSRPENTVCVPRHGLGGRWVDQEICIVRCGEVWQSYDWLASPSNRCCTVFRRGRVLRHCQGRGDIEANLTDLWTDRVAIGGDHCIRQQCGTRNMHQDRIREGATFCNQRVVDTEVVSQERVPVGVGWHVAELGGHWKRKHTRLSV